MDTTEQLADLEKDGTKINKQDGLKQRLKRGEPKKDVKNYLKKTNLPDETIDEVIKKAEEGKEEEFWTKNEKGVIKIVPLLFKRFLEDNGFHIAKEGAVFAL